jgi:tetratricopeptide (TPR) repeat protein
VLTNLGVTNRFQGDFEGAKTCYFESLDLAWQLGAHLEAADILNNLGLLHRLAGEYEIALKHLEQGSLGVVAQAQGVGRSSYP